MSVGPPQASKSPLLWMERPGEEGGRQSEWRLPRSSPSACFSPLTEVLGRATLCGHLLPDGSRAFSLTLPCPLPQCAPQVHQPAVNSWPRAVVVACSLRAIPQGLLKSEMNPTARELPLPVGWGMGKGGPPVPREHSSAELRGVPACHPLEPFFSPQGWSSSFGLCWTSAMREAPLL